MQLSSGPIRTSNNSSSEQQDKEGGEKDGLWNNEALKADAQIKEEVQFVRIIAVVRAHDAPHAVRHNAAGKVGPKLGTRY